MVHTKQVQVSKKKLYSNIIKFLQVNTKLHDIYKLRIL
jgi:hypothetical protein